MRAQRRLALSPLVLTALVLAACGPVSTGPAVLTGGDTMASTGGSAVSQCEPGKEHWRSTGTPVRGGVFIRSAGAGVGMMPNLDITQPGGGSIPVTQVYRHLVKPRACFHSDTIMEPDLAASWEVSTDGLVWMLKLREDARWHDKPPVNGRPVTSADVGWTIDFVKQGGGLRSYWETVSHEEPGPYTVVLRLKQPDAEFLGKLGDEQNVILPREVKEQFGDFKGTAIGAGPYLLKEFRAEQISVLERNPQWREPGADGKPLPYIDEIRAIVFGDYSAEVAAMRSGQLDFNNAQGFRQIEADQLKQTNPKLIAYDTLQPVPYALWLNLARKPLDDVRVRNALSLAIDREELIASNQGGAVLSGFLPAAIKDFAWPVEKVPAKFKTDREQAKQLLAKAGYGPGQVRLTIKTSTRFIQDAEVVQSQLRAIGINVDVSNEGSINVTQIFTRDDWEAVWSGQSPVSAFPDRWLGMVRTGGSHNYFHFSDAKIDALIDAQRKELEPARRKRIIDDIQDEMYEKMPYVPGISPIQYRFYSCRVNNMRSTHFSKNAEGVAEAWLSPASC